MRRTQFFSMRWFASAKKMSSIRIASFRCNKFSTIEQLNQKLESYLMSNHSSMLIEKEIRIRVFCRRLLIKWNQKCSKWNSNSILSKMSSFAIVKTSAELSLRICAIMMNSRMQLVPCKQISDKSSRFALQTWSIDYCRSRRSVSGKWKRLNIRQT